MLFVNNLPGWIKNNMNMFSDDSKICRKIKSLIDGDALQEDLNALVDWSQKWMLRFHNEKCKVMHVGDRKSVV